MSEAEYIKGKGVFVGTFSEDECRNHKDKAAVAEKMKETGYKYTHTEYVKKNGKIVGISIYVCGLNDFTI